MDISNITIEDIYWSLLFGKPKYKATFNQMREKKLANLSPVFFLSTGRCGTNWFANALSSEKSFKVFHEPIPNLGVQGRVAYEIYKKNKFNISDDENTLLQELFLAGREQYFRYSFKSEKNYIETNNHITFFAPAIAQIFPKAKFVHLYRHPGEFVRSAIRRKFYSPDNVDDIKRIKPLPKDKYSSEWEEMSAVAKNAWLWMETNQFIEKFKHSFDQKRVLNFNFNELTEENLKNLGEFIGITSRSLVRVNKKPSNVQKKGNFDLYINWPSSDKEALRNICGNLAVKYGYKL